MKDPAAFHEADLLAVHGPPAGRTCFQTARRSRDGQPVDQHHIFGRGGKDPADRRIHSSIFNCGLLRRDIHHGPMRDRRLQREAYLDEAMTAGPLFIGSPRSMIVPSIVEHTSHHRGALTVYSRTLGLVPVMPYMEPQPA